MAQAVLNEVPMGRSLSDTIKIKGYELQSRLNDKDSKAATYYTASHGRSWL